MNRIETRYIVVHCSATESGLDIGADEIDQWHRGKGWSGIGYHYVIRLDGLIESGRPLREVGAHVRGENNSSVGICLVGGLFGGQPAATYTQAQYDSLAVLLMMLSELYPKAEILGHRDFEGVKKECPCLNVRGWWKHELAR